MFDPMYVDYVKKTKLNEAINPVGCRTCRPQALVKAYASNIQQYQKTPFYHHKIVSLTFSLNTPHNTCL